MLIKIGKLETRIESGYKELCIPLRIDDDQKNVYLRVNKEYGDYLCDERSDGILIALLPFAIRNNLDIECTMPVTEELLYNIKEVLIPAIARGDKKVYRPKIMTEIDTKLNNLGG